MDKTTLKSYDIGLFDIEQEYNKQIAPIHKKIEKLNSSHESKSLRAHKDFLTKEKRSKDKINELNDKTIIRNQKINRAAENKMKKFDARISRYGNELEQFIDEKKIILDEEIIKIEDIIKDLQSQEQKDIEEIKSKYKTNIESYVEKLDIYNNNFEKNKKYHIDEIQKHQKMVNNHISEIERSHTSIIDKVIAQVKVYETQKANDDNDITRTKSIISRTLSNYDTKIRKEANIKLKEIDDYIELFKDYYDDHYKPIIKEIEVQIELLKSNFELRRTLIEKDLEININKLEILIEKSRESKNKKVRKSASMKIDLFNMRATTTVKYEERLLLEKIALLENEISLVKEKYDFELQNSAKLKIFLDNDQQELKNTGEYFKDLDQVLRTELDNFEYTNNNYRLKHEQIKHEFIRNYTKIFKDLKESTVGLAQSYLEKIADNNFEIDEINKFLDTADPLKEIKVNLLREDIEIHEVQERFNIKYAKQNYELELLNNAFNTECKLEDYRLREIKSDSHQEIEFIKNKVIYDKALEKAKLKQSKAQEIYNLRLNNTKLERNLLTNRYETEVDIFAFQKEMAEINVRKHNALISKELEQNIINQQLEADYKVEVIQKRLEEEIMGLQDKVSKIQFVKESHTRQYVIDIDQYKGLIISEIELVNTQTNEKEALIDEALDREIKDPTKNILKTETIIDERLSKFDENNILYVDFINDTLQSYKDDNISLEQIKQLVVSNNLLNQKSEKYVNRLYEVMYEAFQFMNDIEKHALLNKIASTSEQSIIKKANRQLQKHDNESARQLDKIKSSQQDHIKLIKGRIKSELSSITKSKPEDVDSLLTNIEHMHNIIFMDLKDLQENVKSETVALYATLTKTDKEIIEFANLNAEKAKEKLFIKKDQLLEPITQKEIDYLKQLETDKQLKSASFDEELSALKLQINAFKKTALEETKDIKEEKTLLVKTIKEQQQSIKETENQAVGQKHLEIDDDISSLKNNYQQALDKLDHKDLEAKKIFDYEDRIYNIAVEGATGRFEDANTKTKNNHISNISKYRKSSEKSVKDQEQNLQKLNKSLLALTKSFEKNIFTVRPRLEESIGDAQKAIDNEITDKKSKLESLTSQNSKLMLSAENTLFTAFSEGYDKLNNNLTNYIEKYRIIEEEYQLSNQQSNHVLDTNNIAFTNALFELGKIKHEHTIKSLLDINKSIIKEEVS